MRLLLEGAAGPSRECASTCLLVEAVCLQFKLTQVSILSFNGEMQQLLASCNIWGKLNRHPCIQQSCAFGPLGLLCICRLVRQYRARAPSASLYVDTLDTTQSLQRHVLAFVKRSRLLQETKAPRDRADNSVSGLRVAVSSWFVCRKPRLTPAVGGRCRKRPFILLIAWVTWLMSKWHVTKASPVELAGVDPKIQKHLRRSFTCTLCQASSVLECAVVRPSLSLLCLPRAFVARFSSVNQHLSS